MRCRSNARLIVCGLAADVVSSYLILDANRVAAAPRPLVRTTSIQANVALVSGSVVLEFPRTTAGYGVRLHDERGGRIDAVAPAPAAISVCAPGPAAGQCAVPADAQSPQPEIARAYDGVSVARSNGGVSAVATATVTSRAGSTFAISDTYAPGAAPGTFTITRSVTIGRVGANDAGFNSEYAIGFDPRETATANSINDYHFFAPAIWYDKNAFAAPNGLASNFSQRDAFFWRETRSGLPIVMIQEPITGAALTLAHDAPPPTPGAAEDVESAQWLIANALYGSLGVNKNTTAQGDRPVLGFYFPSQEGDLNYTTPSRMGWVRRSNPMRQPNGSTTTQQYELTISLQGYQNGGPPGTDRAAFADAMTGTWRTFYALFDPAAVPVAMQSVYNAGIGLLERNFAAYPVQGMATSYGFPFSIDPFTGQGPQNPVTFQMGFIGQELPLAFQLFRHGQRTGDPAAKADGEHILDFWST